MDADLERDLGQFWQVLFTIVLDAEKRMAAFLEAHKLTTPQFYVLKTLTEQQGRCTIGEIARAHHLTNATMTGLIGRLEKADPPLVERLPGEHDRRQVVVRLTEAGRDRFLAVQGDLLGQLRALLALIDPADRQAVLGYLHSYQQMVVNQVPLTEPSAAR
jgi:DNA-binding MarR family transcriptional regulator